ncbi:hypothetical protein [Asticcacaulis tiandongensis]|uniref:hypothetical protein n=1 Tax=Asticcacaulis tiandongensis TaxID=2565365 RepID=UPI001FED167E|nr:hypothetical protein [Asticcacaulis tiandongensis]
MRRLSDTERNALPQALIHALPVDHIRLIDAPHILCRLARLINKDPLIVARGRQIFWPRLPDDLSKRPEQLALLAHELTHVWQYETGMTLWKYLWRERGRYRYSLVADKPFRAYGYEQQAAMVEDMVRLGHGLPPRWAETPVTLSKLTLVIRFS